MPTVEDFIPFEEGCLLFYPNKKNLSHAGKGFYIVQFDSFS
jgi:hypothetical protein